MKRFSIVQNGYNVDEVNKFVDVVIRRLEQLDNESKRYQAEVDRLNSLLKEKDNESDRVTRALFAIEETSNRIKSIAREEADMIVEEARRNANAIIHESLVNAGNKDREAMILEKNIAIYKARVKSLLEAQMKLVEDMEKIEFEVDK